MIESDSIQSINNQVYKYVSMKEYQTYIFDLDGTLLNTIRDLAASVNYALRSTGMAERTLEEVREFVGNGVKKLMERAVPGGLDNPQFEAAYATFRQHYLHHSLDTTAPYPGIEKLLSELRRRGKRVAIVSNKFYAATQELARTSSLTPWRWPSASERTSARSQRPTPCWRR